MTIDELVGENLRRARATLGLSALDLARRMTTLGLRFDEASLARLEAGEVRITVAELVALGLALGAPPALLLSPLNLASLLCLDAEGRPLASWTLFQGWDNPLSVPGQVSGPDVGERALQQATLEGTAGPTPPSPSPPPPPSSREEPAEAPVAGDDASRPTGSRGAPAADDSPRARRDRVGKATEPPPHSDRLEPPEPAADPEEEPLTPQHRDWALQALRSLQGSGREDTPVYDLTAPLHQVR
ncbi:MAG: hypothetical protein ABIJ48_07815 [Actinomycetota bacterium]